MYSTEQLRKTLRAYVSNAQHNEEKLQRFNRQELQFITSIGLQDLIEVIHHDYRGNFNLDHVSLLLIDEDHEIRHILRSLQLDADRFSISFTETPFDSSVFPQETYPLLGNFKNDAIGSFFNGNPKTLGSAAILPLKRGDKFIGTLNIASKSANRFITGAATDFLHRLACILAVCIENAINHEKIKLLGLIDPLTGIHNRRYFEERLNEEVDNSLRQKENLGLMILDLDFFKSINDNCGHLVGDKVLQEVSALIRKQLRLSDVLARYGGEEFVVIISKSDAGEVHEVAERIRTSLHEHTEFNKLNLPRAVSVSIGLCMLPQNPVASSVNNITKHLLKRADEALYQSKQQGRNRTTVINY